MTFILQFLQMKLVGAASCCVYCWFNSDSFSFILYYSVKSFFNLLISFFNIRMVPELSSLTTALFFIYLARFANSRVDKVSPMLAEEGEMLAMMTVLLLPPRESLRMKVNLLSL